MREGGGAVAIATANSKLMAVSHTWITQLFKGTWYYKCTNSHVKKKHSWSILLRSKIEETSRVRNNQKVLFKVSFCEDCSNSGEACVDEFFRHVGRFGCRASQAIVVYIWDSTRCGKKVQSQLDFGLLWLPSSPQIHSLCWPLKQE